MSKFIDLDSDIVIAGPLIGFADSRPLITPAAFADAVAHWRFGGSSASRADQLSGAMLRLGLAQTAISGGAGYTSSPAVALAGAGSAGLTGYADVSGGAVYSVGISGQPTDDVGAVTATMSGGGATTTATVTLSRGAEPAYTTASAVLAAGRQNGLISPIDDAAVYTEAYLVKRPAGNAQQRIGGTAVYSSGTRGGDGFAWDSNGRLAIQGAGVGDEILVPPASWAAGTFGVLIVSQSATQRIATAFGPDGVSTTTTRAGAKNVAVPTRKRAIGGIHYDFGSVFASLEISSFVYWSAPMSAGQLSGRAYDLLDYARDVGLL